MAVIIDFFWSKESHDDIIYYVVTLVGSTWWFNVKIYKGI